MKKLSVLILLLLLLIMGGCGNSNVSYQIIATTLPVYDFTSAICDGTPLTVGRLITENVSCLHDYTLQVGQMSMIEDADIIVTSGAGLEEFLDDVLNNADICIDSSVNTHLHDTGHSQHKIHNEEHGHHHENDPHIWLSPENAVIMTMNICEGLSQTYPEYSQIFRQNQTNLAKQLNDLQAYGDSQLSSLACNKLITFHDGFAYFAESFDLVILEAVEE